jgi:acetyltransferase-like isoleucine patch superfamily enzyme
LIYYAWTHTVVYFVVLRVWLLCVSLVLAYFVYGFSLVSILGLLRTVLRLNLKEGEYRVASIGMMRWMFINALYIIVSITFMDFILLTPIAALFFRLMGAKVGKNVQINSKNCADLSLLEIGDNTVIGGHATVICHSFERGRLILHKVKIGKNVVIGLNSVVLAGAQIGDGAFITAGAVLGKNKQVEPHSVYAGVPAESTKERRDHDKQ